MELWLAFRSYGARYDWRETFEKHMAIKADAILKSLGLFTYGGQLEPMPSAF